jgi:CHAT domain-containing protein
MKKICLKILALIFFLIALYSPRTSQAQQMDSLEIQTRTDLIYADYKKISTPGAADSLLAQLDSLEYDLDRFGFANKPEMARVIYIKGLVYHKYGQLDIAEDYFLKSKEVFEKLGIQASKIYMNCFQYLGGIAANFERHEQSVEYYEKFSFLIKEIYGANHPNNYYGDRLLAAGYAEIGQYQKSLDTYQNIFNYFESSHLQNSIDYCAACNGMALVLENTGALELSIRKNQEALDCYQKNYPTRLASIYSIQNAIGSTYWDMQNVKMAEKYTRASFNGRKQILDKSHPDYLMSLYNLAGLENVLGRYQKGLAFIQEYQEVLKEGDSTYAISRAGSYTRMASSYEGLGQLDKANESLRLAVALCENDVDCRQDIFYGRFLVSLGLNYKKQGQLDLAQTELENAIVHRKQYLGENHYLTLVAQMRLINLFVEKQNYTEAQSRLDSLFSKYLTIESEIGLWDAYRIKANIHLKQKDYQQAYESYLMSDQYNAERFQRSLTFMSQDELNTYLAEQRGYLNELIDALSSEVDAYPKFATLIYNKVLSFKSYELLASKKIKQISTLDSASRMVYFELKGLKRKLESTLLAVSTDSLNVQKLQSEIRYGEKHLAQFMENVELNRDADWRHLKKNLGNEEAVLEFIHCTPEQREAFYAVLILTAEMEEPKFVLLEDLIPVENEENILKSGINNFYSKSQSWVSKIFDTISPHVKIYYSPSGTLHRVNLGAMIYDGDRLADRHELIRLNSSRELLSKEDDDRKVETASLFGGLIYDLDTTGMTLSSVTFIDRTISELPDSATRGDHQWPYLSSTKTEIEEIDRILKSSNISTNTYDSQNGTEEEFYSQELVQPNILHIATHGYFLSSERRTSKAFDNEMIKGNENPLIRSGLLLANANHAWKTGQKYNPELEDGILTAYEISLMDLSETKLVVLSACETGLGDIDASEGVYGLQRAFKIAGVDKIIMSLWQVPDYHTKELMIQFYKNWLIEKMTIRAALSAAQKSLREEGYEPFYWAGFVLLE